MSVPFSQALTHMSSNQDMRYLMASTLPSINQTSTYVTAYPESTGLESFLDLDGQSFRSSKNYLNNDWSDFDSLLTDANSAPKKSNSQSFDSDMMDLLS